MAAAPAADGLPDRTEIVRRARALVPAIRERAPETERLRRIHPDTVRDLHEAQLWRVHQPVAYGGIELDFGLYIDIGEELGRACAATAWVWMNLVSHNWMLGMWPKEAQDAVWGEDPNTLIGSALIYPPGRAERVEGGYRLSGRWPFSSGIDPSDWVMLGAMAPPDADGDAPTPRACVVRKSEIEVIDTWDVAGLVGSGSHDVACADVFVPEYMAFNPRDARGGPTPGSRINASPLYRLPILGLFPHVVAGSLLGMARGAYDDYVEQVAGRSATYNKTRLAEHTALQLRIAEAGASIDAARLLLHGNSDEATAIAAAERVPTDAEKARWRRDAAFAATLCVKAVDLMYAAAGGMANYRKNPLQRHFRDIHAGAVHIGVSFDVNGAEFGRTALGLPIGNPNV